MAKDKIAKSIIKYVWILVGIAVVLTLISQFTFFKMATATITSLSIISTLIAAFFIELYPKIKKR